MILYSDKISPRLKYITSFIGNELSGEPMKLTSDPNIFRSYSGARINYSGEKLSSEELIINPADLLFENGVAEQQISCFDSNGTRAFFKTGGDYSFDIFAAVFYLLSRYEEYLPHKKDSYGRYAHENSLAFRENFLNLPLINIWINDFKEKLKDKFPVLQIKQSYFRLQPTYDIDEAFAYSHKGILNHTGGLLKSLLKRDWSVLSDRIEVFRGLKQDPYDCFDYMDSLHEKLNLNPVYFFIVAEQKGEYDKNIPPSVPIMRNLIKKTADKYPVGIHPSWKSGDYEKMMESEIKLLSGITGKPVTSSRQHYIRFTLPHTFRRLLEAGITDDYSMGYGSINGFRASVASSFYWYDLEKDVQTDLLIHPFCYMEANSFFEQKYLPQRAYEEMMYYYHTIKKVNSTMIIIWHNNFLGSYPHYSGWKEVYETFLKTVSREN